MTTKHWGEIPKQPASNVFMPDVTADIERSMDKFCLDEYEDDTEVDKIERLILPPMNPLVLYAISLHKYANDMTEMIRVAELATEMNLIPPEDAAPPMPIMPEINLKHKRNTLNYMPKDNSPFANGMETDFPELSDAVVKRIVTKCVVTMFAHIGFETTHQSVLDVLVDVLETFFQKFCHKFVDTLEEEEKDDSSGFPNAIEKVLTETGMGGVHGLNDFYQNRVLKYVGVLQKRCKELNDHYATLLIPKSPSSVDKFGKVLRVKVEEDEATEINPEVHFASFDGETSVLETGYQLLNSLEAQENFQNMVEATDEEVATTSSGIVSVTPEADISHLSPFTKKKRFK